jgi:hypothetical protein
MPLPSLWKSQLRHVTWYQLKGELHNKPLEAPWDDVCAWVRPDPFQSSGARALSQSWNRQWRNPKLVAARSKSTSTNRTTSWTERGQLGSMPYLLYCLEGEDMGEANPTTADLPWRVATTTSQAEGRQELCQRWPN